MMVTLSQLLDQRCVEVHGDQGEYVVYFSRHETITGGYEFAPEEGYREPDVLPIEIRTAAIETFAKRFARPAPAAGK